MSTDTTVSPLRQRMIEDMRARKLGPHSQRSHIHSCRRFAAFLKRSPDTATPDDVRRFQLYLVESGLSAPNEPRILPCPCPRCGGRMIVIEVFERGCEPTYRPAFAPMPIGIDTS